MGLWCSGLALGLWDSTEINKIALDPSSNLGNPIEQEDLYKFQDI